MTGVVQQLIAWLMLIPNILDGKKYNYYGERAVGSGWAKGKVTFVSMNQSQVIRF